MNSRYRPLLLKVRILWLKRPDRSDCPPVYLNPEDKSRYDMKLHAIMKNNRKKVSDL